MKLELISLDCIRINPWQIESHLGHLVHLRPLQGFACHGACADISRKLIGTLSMDVNATRD
jgi:hypothetical protein